ncbi:MAG: class I SAM-dependent methyltransferase [Methanobacterium sp.]
MKKSDNTTPLSSKEYDSNIHKTIPYYDCFHEETIKLIKSMDSKPRTWLDTGCGTGTLIQRAITHFQDTHFLLSDPSDSMLNEARKKLAEYEDKVRILKPKQSHEIEIPVKVDVITAIQSHHYMTKEERIDATKNCYDLLKENGIYVVFENISPLTKRGIQIGKKYWKDFQVLHGKSDEEAINHLERFNMEYFPLNVEEHLELFRSCGFETVELFWYSYMQAGFYCIK